MSDDDQQRNVTYSNPMTSFGSSIVLLTNPKDELYDLELALRGLTQLNNGNILKVCEPLMNKEGVMQVLTISTSIISQITFLSNVTDGEIRKRGISASDTIVKLLMLNRTRFEIRFPESTRDLILNTISEKSFFSMKRALEGGERRFWKGSILEMNQKIQGDKGKGIAEKFFNWNKS